MAGLKFRKKHVPRRRGDDVLLEPGRSVQQTIKRDGVRVTIKQTMKSDGSVSTKTEVAHTLEADLQAKQVAVLKGLPDYGKLFLLAGDQNAAKRGPVAALEAKRTGMEAGEPDLRIYIKADDGEKRILLIENKNGGGYLSKEQKERHQDFEDIGFPVWTIKTDCEDRAAACAVALLRFYQRRQHKGWQDEFPEISRNFAPD